MVRAVRMRLVSRLRGIYWVCVVSLLGLYAVIPPTSLKRSDESGRDRWEHGWRSKSGSWSFHTCHLQQSVSRCRLQPTVSAKRFRLQSTDADTEIDIRNSTSHETCCGRHRQSVIVMLPYRPGERKLLSGVKPRLTTCRQKHGSSLTAPDRCVQTDRTLRGRQAALGGDAVPSWGWRMVNNGIHR